MLRVLSLLVSAYILTVKAQDIPYSYPSFCPDLKLGAYFNMEKWHGMWYEKRHSVDLFCKCSSHYIHHDPNEKDLKATSRLLYYNGTIDVVDNIVKVEKHERPEGTSLTLYDRYMHFEVFYVLETDYVNYSIKYGCYDMDGVKMEYVWILTRDKHAVIPEELIQKTKDIMKANGIEVPLSDVVEECDEFLKND